MYVIRCMLYVSYNIYKPLYSRKYSFPSFWNNPIILYPLTTVSPWLYEYSIWIRFPAESTRESHCFTYWSHCSAANNERSFDIHTWLESRESQGQVVSGIHSNFNRFNDLQCGVVFEPLKSTRWYTALNPPMMDSRNHWRTNDQTNGFQKLPQS